MKTKTKRLNQFAVLFVVLMVAAIGLFVFSPTEYALAGNNLTEAQRGVTSTGAAPGGVTVERVVRNAIRLFSWVIGIASVIMIMVGGLKYITAAGDSSSTKSAKDTILYALIGLVVAALAQVIVTYVLTEAVR